jgi:HSP20 family protein
MADTTAERTVPVPRGQGQAAPTREPTRSEERYVPPAVDIYEDDQGLVLLADMPGVDPGALDVRVERGVLTVQARASHQTPGEPISREYELTGFFRQFQLPEEVDTEQISADMKHGVLTLRLPRAQRAQPRRIQIQAT